MMKYFSRLVDRWGECKPSASPQAVSYESVLRIPSKALPGVAFVINRMSFGRRMDLSRLVREIGKKTEFLEAGSELQEQIEAGILAHEVDAMYLRWGLVSVEGLVIDNVAAGSEQLLKDGPEQLTQEIVAAIKAQCGLNEAERKN